MSNPPPMKPKTKSPPPTQTRLPIRSNTPAPPVNQQAKSIVKFGKGAPKKRGQRIILYGTGGIGKTTLACTLAADFGTCAFIDLDESLAILYPQLEAMGIEMPALIEPAPRTWLDVRKTLQSDGWDGIKNIIIDTASKAEELAIAHVIQTIPSEKGNKVASIEGFGYGKGYVHVYDAFKCLLGDLDRHVREGRNVVIIAHDVVSNVPNPEGDDWIRYEMRLQNSKSASVRSLVKEWSDHVLFLAYDVAAKDKKAKGSGTRSLITAETPTAMAKSRTTNETFAIEAGTNPWPLIVK